MRLLFLVLWVVVLAMPLSSAERAPLTVPAGDEFNIELQSELLEGYQWVLAKPLDPKCLKFVRIKFKRPNGSARNAKGTESLTFKALSEGTTAIHLKYAPLRAEASQSTANTNFIIRIIPAEKKARSTEAVSMQLNRSEQREQRHEDG